MRQRGRISAYARVVVAAGLATALYGVSPSLAAETITVSSTEDGEHEDPGIGCPASDENDCTLRAAIEVAGTNDTIRLPDGTFLLDDEIVLDKSVTIVGAGAGATSVRPNPDGDDPHRLFTIDAPGASVVLEGLELDGSMGSSDSHIGGAVLADDFADLSIASTSFVDNSVDTGVGTLGGAIAVTSTEGQVLIEDSTFEANRATSGSAIYFSSFDGAATIRRVSFVKNSASGPATNAGGAVLINNSDGDLTFRNSTFTQNSSEVLGGAVAAAGTAGISIVQSSFAENTAPYGAAISTQSGASINVANSTFLANSATTAGGVISTHGGANTATFDFVTFADHDVAFDAADGSNVGVTASLMDDIQGCADVVIDDTIADAASDGACGTAIVADLQLSDTVSDAHLTPRIGSPALAAIDDGCREIDQRGRSRDEPCAAGAIDPSGVTCPAEIPRDVVVTCDLDVAVADLVDVQVEINPVLFDGDVTLTAGRGEFDFSVPANLDEDSLDVTVTGDGQTYRSSFAVAPAPAPSSDPGSDDDSDRDQDDGDVREDVTEALPTELAHTGEPLLELAVAGAVFIVAGIALWQTMGRDRS